MLREDRRLKVVTEKKRRGHSDEEGGHRGKNTELPPSKRNATDVLKRSNSCSTSASAILGRKGKPPMTSKIGGTDWYATGQCSWNGLP